MTTLEAGFNMPWYFWTVLIILFLIGWPTLLPEHMTEYSKEEREKFDKHKVPPPGRALYVEAVTDFKLWHKQTEHHAKIVERLDKGETITEGDPDYEMYRRLLDAYKEHEENYGKNNRQ